MKRDQNKLPDSVSRLIEECRGREHTQSYLISVLQKVQECYGFIPRECMDEVARELGVPYAKVTGVATFYHMFNFEPKGKNQITICMGTACYVRGAQKVLERFRDMLGLKPDMKTTDDGMFSVECARCLGACALAPVVVVNNVVHASVKPDDVKKIISDCRKNKQDPNLPRQQVENVDNLGSTGGCKCCK